MTSRVRPSTARADSAALPTEASGTATSIWIMLFLLCVVQPFHLVLGGTTLSPLRVFILMAAVPLLVAMAQGKAGRLRLPDILLGLYVAWMPLPVFINHGAAASVPLLVITIFETLVPYMLARVLIRDARSFAAFARTFLWFVVLFIPFAAIEAVADRNLIAEIYNKLPLIDVFHQVNHEPRMGLHRAQGPFEHPILFGVFCAIPFALAWLTLFPDPSQAAQRVFWTGVVSVAVFLSLSSGALLAVAFQGALIAYDIVFRTIKARWRLFLVLVILLYILADIVIEANPILYAISNLTFSGGSAWNRVRIWELGTDVVANNPIFGIAYRDWPRPGWMPASVDNYWLLVAMRYGLVGFGLFTGAVLAMLIGVMRTDLSDRPVAARNRQALLISFGGTALALATVFVWSGTYATLMFFLGAFGWLLDAPRETVAAPVPEGDQPRRRTPAYTRFPDGARPVTGRDNVADSAQAGGPTPAAPGLPHRHRSARFTRSGPGSARPTARWSRT